MEINFHILRRFWPSIQLLSQMQASKSNDYLNYTLGFILMVLEFSGTLSNTVVNKYHNQILGGESSVSKHLGQVIPNIRGFLLAIRYLLSFHSSSKINASV